MRRGRALAGGLALAALAATLYRRVGIRPRERVELHFDDGSTITLSGSQQIEEFAAHARSALASR